MDCVFGAALCALLVGAPPAEPSAEPPARATDLVLKMSLSLNFDEQVSGRQALMRLSELSSSKLSLPSFPWLAKKWQPIQAFEYEEYGDGLNAASPGAQISDAARSLKEGFLAMKNQVSGELSVEMAISSFDKTLNAMFAVGQKKAVTKVWLFERKSPCYCQKGFDWPRPVGFQPLLPPEGRGFV